MKDKKGGEEKYVKKFEWNRPFTVSTGSEAGSSSAVVFDLKKDDSVEAITYAKGSGGSKFKDEKIYKFCKFKKKIKDQTHFAILRTKDSVRDGSYIDIVFGENHDGQHSHVGFTGSASLFLQLRTGGSTQSETVFNEKHQGVISGTRLYTDKPTGKTIRISFTLNTFSGEIQIIEFSFF